jgi:hypothetical protein
MRHLRCSIPADIIAAFYELYCIVSVKQMTAKCRTLERGSHLPPLSSYYSSKEWKGSRNVQIDKFVAYVVIKVGAHTVLQSSAVRTHLGSLHGATSPSPS